MARESITVLTPDTHLKKATCCIKGILTTGMIFKEGEYYYLFQDTHSGTSPDHTSSRTHGYTYSWVIQSPYYTLRELDTTDLVVQDSSQSKSVEYTFRFKTKEEFMQEGRWETNKGSYPYNYDGPRGWVKDMLCNLGQKVPEHLHDLCKSNESFYLDSWHYNSVDYVKITKKDSKSYSDEPGLITIEKKDKPRKSVEIFSTDNITIN